MSVNGTSSEALAKKAMIDALPSKHVGALWTVMDQMVPPHPRPKAEPHLWKYSELRPVLLEAGRLVGEDEAERRVLMLVNPSLGAPYTTDTLYAGLQLINPGETAPAHRHTAFALRYIIEGERGFTAVEGQKISMHKGDVILTPKWNWHDHGHEGDGPMIWLDGLDLPLFQSIPVNFAQPYHAKRYPSSPVSDSPIRFQWSDVVKALDDGSKHSIFRYRLANGDEVSPTIGAQAERIAAGATSKPRRDTCSYVFHCAQGKGVTKISLADGSEPSIAWEANDTFAVPSWSVVQHTADAKEEAYFFVFSDYPLIKSLGMYRDSGAMELERPERANL